MHRFAVAMAVCGLLAIVSPAQEPKSEPKWEPPAPPAGWKAIMSKDGTYRFAVPPGIGRSGTRERTLRLSEVSVRSQSTYFLSKDGSTLEVGTMVPSGAALKGVTFGQAMDAMVDAMERDEGYSVSARKDVAVGKIKAREYRVVTKENIAWRLVMFAAKPRIYLLIVASTDPANLDTETADTFLQSLILVPPEVVKEAAKEKAATDAQTGSDNLEKYGFKWTTALKDMTAPDMPVIGVIRGKEFKPDTVKLDRGNWLVFRQGEKGVYADIEVKVWLIPKAGESVENKTYEIATTGAAAGSNTPHIRMAVMTAGRPIPQSEAFLNKYAMKLTLAAKDADGKIPGTIYLCTPDTGKSFMAGTFTATQK